MIRLNDIEYAWRPGLSLAELMDAYNTAHTKISFEGFVVIIDGAPIPAAQARTRLLRDNERVFITPMLDGG